MLRYRTACIHEHDAAESRGVHSSVVKTEGFQHALEKKAVERFAGYMLHDAVSPPAATATFFLDWKSANPRKSGMPEVCVRRWCKVIDLQAGGASGT